jgi:AraC-like DNA-binding protein
MPIELVAPPRATLAPITTMLTPNERLRVDAAGAGVYRAMHRDTLDEVIRDVRERGAAAVVVSVARCGRHDAARVATMVREFPRVPAVALLTELAPATPQAVLSLGRSGVRSLVDVRQPAGWRELRQLLMDDRAAELERSALAQLAGDLSGAPEGCRRFFDALFTAPVAVSTVRHLTRTLGVLPSTLMSRFLRAQLPSPKRYLAMARLARAARLFENGGLSVANVATHLDYSSPQSFGRHVRTLLGLTAVGFRQRYDGDGMLERFRADLVRPYATALRGFDPLKVRL